jgi:hypothetical protein
MALPFNAGRPLLRAPLRFLSLGRPRSSDGRTQELHRIQRAEPQAASPLRECLTANRSRRERPKRIA